ncbi:MAG: hypothetical protein QFB86_01610 [Patescibacteria group bacterium]|nr:hypothetical protein [Patescibacteria group bacterium]
MTRPTGQFIKVGFVLVLLVGGVTTIAHVLSSPAHGRSTTSISTRPIKLAPKAPEPEPASTSNQYYMLKLPAEYSKQTGSQKTPQSLFQENYLKRDSAGTQIISIGIADIGSGNLNDLSGYQLRMQPNAAYTKITKVVAGTTVDIFSDSRSPSVVAYWKHGTLAAIIGVSSGLENSGDESNETQMKAIEPVLQGWRWQ